jgi:hypothetical protein
MSADNGKATDYYQFQIDQLERSIAAKLRVLQQTVWVRLGLAFPGVSLFVVGLLEPAFGASAWITGLVLLFGFLVAATWNENQLWHVQQWKQRLVGFQRLQARTQRLWSELPPKSNEEETASFRSDLSKDIDLFGDRSLYRWSALAMTRSGARLHSQWMTQWADDETIRERQKAVRELTANRPWRMDFFVAANGCDSQAYGPEGLVSWTNDGDFFSNRSWLKSLTWLGPMLFLFGVVTFFSSRILEWEAGLFFGLGSALLGIALNFLLTMFIVGPIHDIFVRIGAANRELQSLTQLIELIIRIPAESRLIESLKNLCYNQDHSAVVALLHLRRIMGLAGMQRSPLFFIPYVVLQMTVLWDIRILGLLEGWKKRYGQFASGWLEAIGTVEVLSSGAAIADEYPAWCYPSIGPNAVPPKGLNRTLELQAVSHPLLKDANRVPNDLTIRPDRPLLLVTGSNMAGKSTLLRSVGINAVLARLGSPVCAKSWESASLELASSIQVQDSLQDGVSFFMAELKRLRGVVDQAQSEDKFGGRQMLILLDEILQGTNSRERQIAVEHVLDRLVGFGCIVFTSTHDLELAGHSSIQNQAQIVHFREYFEMVDGREKMKFDYIMRDGVTPTTNALKLLELVGLK